MSLKLYLLRHAETAASVTGQYIGSGTDVPLTSNGLQMAEKLGERFKNKTWAAFYSSPALRVKQTIAPILREEKIDVQYRPGLIEINYGQWEEKSAEEVKAISSAALKSFYEDGERFAPPGGETVRQVWDRTKLVIDEITAKYKDGDVFVASHRTTLRVLLCALFGIELRRYREVFEYHVCSLSVVEYRDGKPILLTHGDRAHLD